MFWPIRYDILTYQFINKKLKNLKYFKIYEFFNALYILLKHHVTKMFSDYGDASSDAP